MCVCLLPTSLFYTLKNKVPLGFSSEIQYMHCVDFVENALFKSSGDIF